MTITAIDNGSSHEMMTKLETFLESHINISALDLKLGQRKIFYGIKLG